MYNKEHKLIATGSFKNRNDEVKSMINTLYYLKLTKNNHPAHPLYLKKDLKPELWKKIKCY